jgi:hypothetical protein
MRITYKFEWTWPHDDYLFIDDITLYGDGTYARGLRRTQ